MSGAGSSQGGGANAAADAGKEDRPGRIAVHLEADVAGVVGIDHLDLLVDLVRHLELADGRLVLHRIDIGGLHQIGKAAALGDGIDIDVKICIGQKHIDAGPLQSGHRLLQVSKAVHLALIRVLAAEHRGHTVQIDPVLLQNCKSNFHNSTSLDNIITSRLPFPGPPLIGWI